MKTQAAGASDATDFSARRYYRRYYRYGYRPYYRPYYYARPDYYRPYPYYSRRRLCSALGFGPVLVRLQERGCPGIGERQRRRPSDGYALGMTGELLCRRQPIWRGLSPNSPVMPRA